MITYILIGVALHFILCPAANKLTWKYRGLAIAIDAFFWPIAAVAVIGMGVGAFRVLNMEMYEMFSIAETKKKYEKPTLVQN